MRNDAVTGLQEMIMLVVASVAFRFVKARSFRGAKGDTGGALPNRDRPGPGIVRVAGIALAFYLTGLFGTGSLHAQVTLTTLLGETHNGDKVSVLDGRWILEGEREQSGALEELGELTLSPMHAGGRRGGSQTIIPVNGGRLFADIKTLDAETIGLELFGQPLSLGLDALAAAVWRDSPLLDQQLAEPSAGNDRLLASGGTGDVVVAGLLEGLADGKFSVQFEGQTRTISADRVAAFLPARLAELADGESNATVVFVDGGSWTCKLVRLQNGQLDIEVAGRVISLRDSDVAAIRVLSDRMLRLTDLVPLEYEQQTLFTAGRDWQRNRSVSGGPLTLVVPGGSGQPRVFTNGIGMRSWSRLAFASEARFDRLLAQVGIDAETGGKGDCVVSVRGDGISLWSSRIRGGEPAIPVDVEITGLQRVELLVEPGEQFDLADHVDWVDARLVRTK
jgi:NPCBM/NEW2 domain